MDQMDWVHRTFIISADKAPTARQLADAFGESSKGMFQTPLQGEEDVPTHYISSGLVDRSFADMLGSPQGLVDGCAEFGVELPLEVATALLAEADVSDEAPSAAMARLGLKLHQEA